MPCMDGFEATEMIKRKLAPFRNLTATFVALSAQEECFIRDIEAFDDFRTKPLTMEVIEGLLRTYGF